MDGITDPTKPYFNKGKWTWDGSEWRRQPLLFGFSEVAGESLSDTNIGAGTNNLDGAAVAAGEVMVVQQVSCRYDGTVPSSMLVIPSGTPSAVVVLFETTIVSASWYLASCFLVLEAGDFMRVTVHGATAGDDLYFRYAGFKMSIVE